MEAIEEYIKPWVDVIDSENRRSPRFDIHLPIEYYQIKPSFTHTGNISERGLLLFFPLGPELNTIKVLAKAVWMDNHLSKGQEYYPCGVKFVDIPQEDGTKLRNFLRSLSSPLDDMLSLFNTLKVRFWIRKFMNPPRGYIPGRQRREILSLVTKFDGNRGTKKPPPLRDRQF